MAYLFKVENKAVFPNDETLLISPYKEIWERDKSKEKRMAMKEFAYIEFMCSMRKTNPYKGYEESLRTIKIKEDVIQDKKWKPDSLVTKGVSKLKEFQTGASNTYSFFMSVKKAVSNLKDFFDNVDLGERNMKTGNPIYKPAEITRALADADKLLNNFSNLERKVEEELFEESKTKGGKEISPFANPDSI